MALENYLYNAIVDITNDYLGPPARRFIARQIKSHLHKEPEEIVADDIKELVAWLKIAMNILTDDRQMVNEYVTAIRNLTKLKAAKSKS